MKSNKAIWVINELNVSPSGKVHGGVVFKEFPTKKAAMDRLKKHLTEDVYTDDLGYEHEIQAHSIKWYADGAEFSLFDGTSAKCVYKILKITM